MLSRNNLTLQKLYALLLFCMNEPKYFEISDYSHARFLY